MVREGPIGSSFISLFPAPSFYAAIVEASHGQLPKNHKNQEGGQEIQKVFAGVS